MFQLQRAVKARLGEMKGGFRKREKRTKIGTKSGKWSG
jgi:hypothetical protein